MKKNPPLRFSGRTEEMKGEAAYAVLAKTEELERRGKHIIHLEIGQPDFDTPKDVSAAGMRAINEGKTKYAVPLGIPELRAAVASHIEKTRGIPVSPSMVAITPSAKSAIFLAMIAALKPEDEVIYPDPGFPAYGNLARYFGCVSKPVPLLEKNGFSFDLNAFSRLLTSKTRMVILNSPSNPTGGVIPKKDLKTIYELVEKRDCWVVSDEIYSDLTYDNIRYPSFYSIKGAAERTMLVHGFSKTYSMTGWRLGYLILPEQFTPMMDNLIVNSFACTATFTQYAGVTALSKAGVRRDVKKMVREFEKRRNCIVSGLNEIPGIRCLKPQGAFYVFPNISQIGMKSQKLADYLLEEAGVALLPGTAFGEYGEGYLRISYANSIENISQALKKIRQALRKL